MKLALGTVQFGLHYGVSNAAGRVSADEVARILDAAEAAGIRVLDTARGYGTAEAVLGELHAGERFDVVTKTLPVADGGVSGVERGIAESVAALGGRRLYGGMIAAQSLAAAAATVDPSRLPQSLHAYYIKGGKAGVDITYTVERTRDGRSFDTRRVTAVQNGAAIFEMLASFHRPEATTDWQRSGKRMPVENHIAAPNERHRMSLPTQCGKTFLVS